MCESICGLEQIESPNRARVKCSRTHRSADRAPYLLNFDWHYKKWLCGDFGSVGIDSVERKNAGAGIKLRELFNSAMMRDRTFVWSWSLISNHTKVIFIDFQPRWIEVIKLIGHFFFFVSSFDSPLSFTIKIRRRQKGWGRRTKLDSTWLNRLFTWNAEGRSGGVHDFSGTWEKRRN